MPYRVWFLSSVLVTSALMGAAVAFAATDGTLGATSTGRANMTITINRELRISNLNDINLGTFDPANSPLFGTDTLCIYDNGLAGYQVTLSSTNGAGVFQMQNGTDFVTYSVEYDDSGVGANYVAVAEGGTLTGRTGATTVNDTCITNGADNATVRVRVVTSDLANADTNGTYTDTLNLVVAPTP